MDAAIETDNKKYTLEAYLSLEERSEEKHEYIRGKIIAISGATANHNLIAANIIVALKIALRNNEKKYYVMGSDMKIHIEAYQHVRYPDAVVICEKLSFFNNRKDIIINPLLIVEVLSESTAQIDRGKKFDEYQSIPSLKEYVLVRQDMPDILTFYREAPDLWRSQQVRKLEETIYLKSLSCSLALAEVYEGVEWT